MARSHSPAAWPKLCRPAISDAAQLSHVDMAWHSQKRAASLATRSGTESDEAAWWRSYTCEMQHRQQQRRQLVQRKLEDLICNMPPAMQPATCRTNAQLTCHLSPFHHGACHAPQAGRGRHAARPHLQGRQAALRPLPVEVARVLAPQVQQEAAPPSPSPSPSHCAPVMCSLGAMECAASAWINDSGATCGGSEWGHEQRSTIHGTLAGARCVREPAELRRREVREERQEAAASQATYQRTTRHVAVWQQATRPRGRRASARAERSEGARRQPAPAWRIPAAIAVGYPLQTAGCGPEATSLKTQRTACCVLRRHTRR